MAGMREETRRAVLAEMRPAHEMAAEVGRSAQLMQNDLVCWRGENRIFSVEYGGTEYFPLFALDAGDGYQPYPAFGEALRILNASKWGSDWAVAAWFVGLSSFLNDQRPADLLACDPGWVIDAARDAVSRGTNETMKRMIPSDH